MNMNTYKKLKKLGLFTLKEAKDFNISHMTILRAVKEGEIEKLARGYYKFPEIDLDPQIEQFAIACKRLGPKSLIGGLTSLAFHQLIEESVEQIWVIVPPYLRCHDPLYRCIRSKTSANIGIEKFSYFRMANIERSIIESIHYLSKFGESTGINAARKAIKNKQVTLKSLTLMAKELKFENDLAKKWSAITAE
jgi:predicted transcriptional regulator of viral defense system